MKQLFIFVDGIGIAPESPDNPVNSDVCPAICELIKEHSTSIDSCLGVEGLPQSATGQATMFTGRNASQYMGRHVEGFPGPTLRKFVEAENIFTMLKTHGKRARFSDAYLADSIDEIRNRRFKSVTTTAALTTPEVISLKPDLMANQAVLHDITRETLLQKGYHGNPVTPVQAAEHLAQITLGYDYTLFEYFLTDTAGHSRDMNTACGVLHILDAFLGALFPLLTALNVGITLTSDHGNIESMSVKGHTRNPVPLIAVGPCADNILKKAVSLIDINSLVLESVMA